ncbi:MAG: stage V sporulation protein T [Clostridia bacterium]|nr:stage V sporulation protein T [Clostridia bacterium]
MKATGIVRRIDDLGRVVIPKEIRRTMRIREGDPLEIYTDREGEVIFKKYSPIGELMSFAAQYADTLNKTCGMSVIITDRDVVIACAGVPKKEYTDKKISGEIEDVIESRTLYVKAEESESFSIIEDSTSHYVSCAMPIISDGDIVGCVASLSLPEEKNKITREVETKLIQTAASFLGKQLEA